jgi:hypothetical protein
VLTSYTTDISGTDIGINEEIAAEPFSSIDLEIEEEEAKPKLELKLAYNSFRIHGHSLCVVVEPWPPRRFSTKAPSVMHKPPRELSIAPPDFVPTGEGDSHRSTRPPLFLPDVEVVEGAAPRQNRMKISIDLTVDDSDEDQSDDGGMMQFSQVLNATGEFRAGADDDDGMDGTAFLGDADEGRE